MNQQPRMHVLAGPNGSGKSTAREFIPIEVGGPFINADEIEREIRAGGYFSASQWDVSANGDDVGEWLRSSSFLAQVGLREHVADLVCEDEKVWFNTVEMNSYIASALADFLRRRLVDARRTFTFETVMSSADKVALMRMARVLGYRVHLYFVATEAPEINIDRVAQRVARGGHDVPREKIVSRYSRSLDNLYEAVVNSNGAYIFDNSSTMELIAIIREGAEVEVSASRLPHWVEQYLLRFYVRA